VEGLNPHPHSSQKPIANPHPLKPKTNDPHPHYLLDGMVRWMGRGAIGCAMPVAWRRAAVGWYGGADGSMARWIISVASPSDGVVWMRAWRDEAAIVIG